MSFVIILKIGKNALKYQVANFVTCSHHMQLLSCSNLGALVPYGGPTLA